MSTWESHLLNVNFTARIMKLSWTADVMLMCLKVATTTVWLTEVGFYIESYLYEVTGVWCMWQTYKLGFILLVIQTACEQDVFPHTVKTGTKWVHLYVMSPSQENWVDAWTRKMVCKRLWMFTTDRLCMNFTVCLLMWLTCHLFKTCLIAWPLDITDRADGPSYKNKTHVVINHFSLRLWICDLQQLIDPFIL